MVKDVLYPLFRRRFAVGPGDPDAFRVEGFPPASREFLDESARILHIQAMAVIWPDFADDG